jgi:hypothetical protein
MNVTVLTGVRPFLLVVLLGVMGCASGSENAGSGGATSSPGGNVTETGGNAISTGGFATVSGGSRAGAGGAMILMGGAATLYGGSTTASGGTSSARGGATAQSGGTMTSSGGTTAASGGATTVQGGVVTSSGGNTSGAGGSSGSRDAGTMGSNRDSGVAGGTTGAGGSGSGGNAGTGGTSAAGGATGATGKVFSQCRFHFGTIDSLATSSSNNPSIASQIDFFTPGWMKGNTFDQSYVCKEANAGGSLANIVPVDVAYIAAAMVERSHSLCDCNVTSGNCGGGNLCSTGAYWIANDWASILSAYQSYSSGFAACYGTTKPIIFEMEPDWYQYTGSGQKNPSGGSAAWTFAQAGSRMTELVNALKTSLPNAVFSLDISPWVGTDNNTGSNGSDNGARWYSSFSMNLYTFINTSGGSTFANGTKIRGNAMTWGGVSTATGKPILADTGYGAAGVSAGEDSNWNLPANINARMADGVVSISQYNPTNTWGGTISSIRSQLNTPKFCP